MNEKSDSSGDSFARLVYEATSEALYLAEQEESLCRLLSVNPSLCRLFDRQAGELVGQPLRELWSPQAYQEVERYCEETLGSGQSVTFEQTLELPSGTRTFQHTLTPIAHTSHRVLLAGSLRDISSHKDRERIILRLSRMYALISQINQMVVRVTDRESLFRQACDIAVNFGKLRMAWIGLVDKKTRNVLPCYWAGHEEGYLKKMVQVSTEEMSAGLGPTGSAIREDKHVICQDIARDPRLKPWREDALQRGYRSSIALPLTENGEVIGSFNLYADEPFFFDGEEVRLLDESAMDISFALQVLANEEKLHDSMAFQESLLRTVPFGMNIVDQDGKILYMSDKLLEQFGSAKPDSTCWQLYREDQTRCTDCPLHEEIMIGRTSTVLSKGIRDARTLRITHTGMLFEGQKALLELFEDVTDAENMEKQLRQARKMETVGRLAGGIAHDFNNKLMVITTWAELLKQQILPDSPGYRSIRAIEDAAWQSRDLTRQLLAFSRKQILKPISVDLNNTVRGMGKMLQRLIGEHITLKIRLDNNCDPIFVDPGQLDQSIMNLAINARDAMPDGGSLTLQTCRKTLDETYCRTHVDVQPGAYIALTVTDTGCGMTEEIRKQVFEPFFTTKPKGEGTGLGLATVHGIVYQSGGHITCYSEPDLGTTFRVYFPPSTAVAVDTVVRTTPTHSGHGRLVLVVEDEIALHDPIKELLLQLNYRVTLAGNGSEALQKIEDGLVPDLLITDMVMPVMGGVELSTKVYTTLPDLQVLFMSGYSDIFAHARAILPANVVFVEKPFSLSELTEALERLEEKPTSE